MTLTLITPPATAPISLSEMKLHARIDSNDDDTLVSRYINAATQRLDGRDGGLGICLITQVWKLSLDSFPVEIIIPLRPCQSIDAITYLASDGSTQTLAADAYRVTGLDSMDGARITPAYGRSWPATLDMSESVSVTFTAGFGDAAGDVPEQLRIAVAMRAAHLYEQREGAASHDGLTVEGPDGPDDFTRNFREFVF